MNKIIDGVRIAYDDAGSGETLVLLHGFLLDRSIWDAQYATLARICRVIRIDLRGSGESGCGEGPALMETLAGDVFGLLDALGVERAIVAGHSMGGYAALAFFRMYAERVAGLALVASHVGADPSERQAERDDLAAALAVHGMAPAIAALVPRLIGAASLARDPTLADRVREIALRQDAIGAAAQVIGMKERVGSEDLLEDIMVPALIVGGDADALIPLTTFERTAMALADCEFARLPGCGHLPMLEQPEATRAALERLIARCAPHSEDPKNVRATHV